jgi:hypothetical protein
MYNADEQADLIYKSGSPVMLLELVDKFVAPKIMINDALFVKLGFWETRYLNGTYDKAMKSNG